MAAETDLQCAIYQALSAALAVPVYDEVPQEATPDDGDFPFVVVGDDTLSAWDDDLKNGFQATVTIHAFSRYRGRKEIKDLQGAIYDALHRNDTLAIGSFGTAGLSFLTSSTILESDGITRHGIQSFEVFFSDPHPGLTPCP
jgi:hypothetical protein